MLTPLVQAPCPAEASTQRVHLSPLTATPNSGYRFVGWVEGGTTVSTNTNYIFVANSNRSLTAQFDRISSGGGDSDPTYSITLPSRVTGGELKLSRRYAEKGETVTLTAVPDEGYELDTLTVTDSKGNEIDLTDQGGNEYTFKMPAGRVTIDVTFRKTGTPFPLPTWAKPTGRTMRSPGHMRTAT